MSLKKFFLTCTLVLACIASAKGNTLDGGENKYDGWENVINAIIQVESRGNPKAFNKEGNCAGILQIRPILVKDCNRIVGYEKFTLEESIAMLEELFED